MSNITNSETTGSTSSASLSALPQQNANTTNSVTANTHIEKDRYYYLKAMIPPGAKKVLDIGCGYGYTFGYLSEIDGLELHGLDMDATALKEARANYPHVNILHQTAAQLPYPDETFDVAILSEVIEHVGDENKEFVISEAYRVLKPGGTFLFTAPFAGVYAWLDPMDVKRRAKGLYKLYMVLSRYQPSTAPEIGHKHVTLDEINTLFAGKFSITHIQYCGGISQPLMTWTLAVLSRLRLLGNRAEQHINQRRADLSGVKVSPRRAYFVRLTAKRL